MIFLAPTRNPSLLRPQHAIHTLHPPPFLALFFQARIALLEGERRGTENLKTDLMRRVKMLEYALRQERNKYLTNVNLQKEKEKEQQQQLLQQQQQQKEKGQKAQKDKDVRGSNKDSSSEDGSDDKRTTAANSGTAAPDKSGPAADKDKPPPGIPTTKKVQLAKRDTASGRSSPSPTTASSDDGTGNGEFGACSKGITTCHRFTQAKDHWPLLIPIAS